MKKGLTSQHSIKYHASNLGVSQSLILIYSSDSMQLPEKSLAPPVFSPAV